MSITARRLLSAAFVLIAVCLTGIAGAVATVVGDSERVARYDAVAELSASDSTVAVTEVIEYDFGRETRRGIERTIPDLTTAGRASVRVGSPTAPDDLQIIERRGTVLRVGDPAVNIKGRHVYQIDYTLETVLQGDRLSWNAIGTDTAVDTEETRIHLLSPFELSNIECFVGLEGSTRTCSARQLEAGHVLITTGSMAPNVGITVNAILDPDRTAADAMALPQIAPPDLTTDDPGVSAWRPFLVTLGLGSLAALPAIGFTRRMGREQVWEGANISGLLADPWSPEARRAEPAEPGAETTAVGVPAAPTDVRAIRRIDAKELSEMASIDFAPPPDRTPSEGGVIWAEKAKTEHVVAWLLERALTGEIDLVPEGKGDDLVLHRGSTPVGDANLERMLRGRDRIDLSSYDASFGQGWEQQLRAMNRYIDKSPLWDERGARFQTMAVVLGVIAALAGLALVALGAFLAAKSGAGPLVFTAIGAVLAGLALGTLFFSWELKVRSPKGSEVWVRLESFRRFLERSEAKHVEWAAEHGLLREYSAWAVALDQADHWNDLVKQSPVASQYDPTGVHLALISSRLGSSVRTASTAPSSSSGGGGGGSVGGGGGGGGVGSW